MDPLTHANRLLAAADILRDLVRDDGDLVQAAAMRISIREDLDMLDMRDRSQIGPNNCWSCAHNLVDNSCDSRYSNEIEVQIEDWIGEHVASATMMPARLSPRCPGFKARA